MNNWQDLLSENDLRKKGPLFMVHNNVTGDWDIVFYGLYAKDIFFSLQYRTYDDEDMKYESLKDKFTHYVQLPEIPASESWNKKKD